MWNEADMITRLITSKKRERVNYAWMYMIGLFNISRATRNGNGKPSNRKLR
jgi:hypothetical protein